MNRHEQIRRPNTWVWALGTGAVWWAAATVALTLLCMTGFGFGIIGAITPLVCFGVGAQRGWNQAEQQNHQITQVLSNQSAAPAQQVAANCTPAMQQQQEQRQAMREQKRAVKHAERIRQRAVSQSFADEVHATRTLVADTKGI